MTGIGLALGPVQLWDIAPMVDLILIVRSISDSPSAGKAV